MNNLQEPLNTEERYLHGINVRLNILIEMMSSFLDVYAEKEEVVTENNEEIIEEVEEKVIEEAIEEDEEEVVEEDKFDYSELTKSEIMKDLDIYGVEYNTNMLKSELVELANKYL